jgi:subtilisin family serine protease
VKINYLGLSGDDPTITQFATNSGTATGHAAAVGAASMGASYFRANQICLPATYPNYTLEDYSSSGGTPILFDAEGNRLAAPVVRQKPDFVAPDGGNTTFFFSPLGARTSSIPACVNLDGTYNFFGTSAAAPHAAGVAALLLQAQPKATPAQIFKALSSTAIDMGAPGVDFDTGAGFIQADAALTALAPVASLSTQVRAFGPVVIRSGTGSQSVTLTNTGGSVLTVGIISVTGAGYTVSSNCGTAVAAQASCTITVGFATQTAGTYPGTLSIASDGVTGGTSQVALTATGSVPPGGGAFGLMMLLPGFAAALLRRRRKSGV